MEIPRPPHLSEHERAQVVRRHRNDLCQARITSTGSHRFERSTGRWRCCWRWRPSACLSSSADLEPFSSQHPVRKKHGKALDLGPREIRGTEDAATTGGADAASKLGTSFVRGANSKKLEKNVRHGMPRIPRIDNSPRARELDPRSRKCAATVGTALWTSTSSSHGPSTCPAAATSGP